MGIREVEQYFEDKQLPFKIIVLDESSATVDLAASALGVEPALIAKTLAIHLKEQDIILVTSGTSRISNKKMKAAFHCKPKMMNYEETLTFTGHPVGGVCPFALREGTPIYLDESLKAFVHIYPAAGSGNSAVKLTPQQLAEVTQGHWLDLCE